MTKKEFSDLFDVFLNSFGYVGSINLDEYEKSVYLTKAHWELIIRYYNGQNAKGDAFENSEEVRNYLKSLVKNKEFSLSVTSDSFLTYYSITDDLDNTFSRVAFIVMELATIDDSKIDCNGDNTFVSDVIPVNHDDFLRIRRNPFKGATKYRVLRLNEDNIIKLISKFNLSKYRIVYLEKPKPIVLVDLPDGLTVDGESQSTDDAILKESELIHKNILELAVRLAIADRQLKESKKED